MKKLEQVKFGECFLPCNLESFVSFYLKTQRLKIYRIGQKVTLDI
jgi:hypothetical protein